MAVQETANYSRLGEHAV